MGNSIEARRFIQKNAARIVLAGSLTATSIGLGGCGQAEKVGAQPKENPALTTAIENRPVFSDQSLKAINEEAKRIAKATITADRLAQSQKDIAGLEARLEKLEQQGSTIPKAVERQPEQSSNGQANNQQALENQSVQREAQTVPSTVESRETQQTSEAFKFTPPTSFRPEDPGGVQNVFLEEASMNTWFHPMTKIRFQGNEPWIWSYQYYFANSSTALELVQHAGEEGRLIFRQETGPSRLVLGVGILDTFTDSKGVTKDLHNDIRTGFDPNVIPSIWIRTHPNVKVRVFDPDTGQALMKDGRPVEGITSESGDIGFGLGDQPNRFVFVADVPFDPKLETFVWKGPHDRVQEDVNWIDLRNGKKPVGKETVPVFPSPTVIGK